MGLPIPANIFKKVAESQEIVLPYTDEAGSVYDKESKKFKSFEALVRELVI